MIKASSSASIPLDLMANSTTAVLTAVSSFMKCYQEEKTNREEIKRKRDTALSVIKAEKDVMLGYLKLKFGERSSLYKEYFSLIDTAIKNNDSDTVSKALEGITKTYEANPFLGFEDFKKAARDSNAVIEL